MKKITLITLVLFFIITGTIFLQGIQIEYYPTDYEINAVAIYQERKDAAEELAKEEIEQNELQANTEITTELTIDEVAKHNTSNDCYLLIDKNVYDVSSYISEHPGGKKNITNRCGKEVTGIFARIHSNKAWDLLAKYKINEIQ